MSKIVRFLVEIDSQGMRLDKFLAKELPAVSRSSFKRLIKEGELSVNKIKVKPGYLLKENDEIELILPLEEEVEIKPEAIPLDIIYEDDCLLVVNKPVGMIVHPADKIISGTLVNALLNRTKDLSSLGGSWRRGIVHRLDKDTSGLLVVAKDDNTHFDLAKQFKERRIKREYLAIVRGKIKEREGKIEIPIGRHPKNRKKISAYTHKGKKAVTFYKVIEIFPNYTYVSLRLGTGRTHQIRVHLSYMGHPLAGDKTYGGKLARKESLIRRPALHAHRLGFRHPGNNHFLEFSVPPPGDFQKSLKILASSLVRT